MSNYLGEAEQLLDSLDKDLHRDARAAERRATRRTWRKRLKVMVTHPGGVQRPVAVVTRNLSSGGLAFLYNGFLHLGTRCEAQLMTEDNAWVDVQATVAWCRYVTGRLHEVGIRFQKPIDDGLFVSQELSASILLVDDAEDVLSLTGHFLRKAGAEVVTTNRGLRALKLVAEHDFDLVLLDLEMPGISGLNVLGTLRERGVTIPIIAYTAHDDQAKREECLAAGFSDVLVKPMSKTDLIDAVMRYLAVEESITSKYAGNPEMHQFICEFVSGLPGRIEKMLRCVQAQNAEELGALARQLKIAASDNGGCGFAELSAAAGRLVEKLAGVVDWDAADKELIALSTLSHRVQGTPV